jgi:hypothetical protein
MDLHPIPPSQYQKRHKTCAQCSTEYCDITKRFVGVACSQECASKMMTSKRRQNGSYTRTPEQNEKVSVVLKQQYASGERKPTTEAMLSVGWDSERLKKREQTYQEHYGVTHWSKTQEGRKRISQVHTGKSSKVTLEQRRKMSEAAKRRLKNENQYSRCKKGKRPDLNDVFFRSSWEANYARILNHLGVGWQYEPETFQVGEAETYTPDFRLDDGTLIEIKGWWTESGKRKVELFREKHPEFTLQTITRTEYTVLSKQYRSLIANWE